MSKNLEVVAFLHKNGKVPLLEGMEHYYDRNDFNGTFYYSDSSKTDDRLAAILKDAYPWGKISRSNVLVSKSYIQ